MIDRCRNAGFLVSGRYLLWFVLKQFAKDAENDPGESLADLYEVVCHGDAGLERFLTTCASLTEICTEPISEPVLRMLFLKQLKKCTCMTLDLQRYDEFALGSENRSFSWLWLRANSRVETMMKVKQRGEYVSALRATI